MPDRPMTAVLLIVEDDESLRRIVARHLRAQGYAVERGRLGRGGRRRARRRACGPALVLLDLNLPGDTGWDLLREPALAPPGRPPVVITQRDDRQPAAARRVRRAPATCPSPSRSRRSSRPIERVLDPEETQATSHDRPADPPDRRRRASLVLRRLPRPVRPGARDERRSSSWPALAAAVRASSTCCGRCSGPRTSDHVHRRSPDPGHARPRASSSSTPFLGALHPPGDGGRAHAS